MNITYLKLWFTIKFSRVIPKKIKPLLLGYLSKKIPFSFENSKKLNELFYTAMFYRAYDIFTTSLYALLLKNEVSFCALLRIQVENYVLTEHILQKPEKLKKIFDEKIEFRKAVKNLKNETSLRELCHFLSQKVHSFPEGLKSCFSNMFILNAENLWEPWLALKGIHSRIENEHLEELFLRTLYFYHLIKENIKKIKEMDFEDEIENYKKLHKKDPNKKEESDDFPKMSVNSD